MKESFGNVIVKIKRYLKNWPERELRPSFWSEHFFLFKSIPRIVFWFVLPALLVGLIERLTGVINRFLMALFPYLSPLGWSIILYIVFLGLFAWWVES